MATVIQSFDSYGEIVAVTASQDSVRDGGVFGVSRRTATSSSTRLWNILRPGTQCCRVRRVGHRESKTMRAAKHQGHQGHPSCVRAGTSQAVPRYLRTSRETDRRVQNS